MSRTRVPVLRALRFLSHHRLASGFTLIEVLVAIVILTVGALAAIKIQRDSTMANQSALNREVAGALARQLLERIERVPFPDPPGGGTYANCLADTLGAYVVPCAALSPGNPLDPQGQNAPTNGFFNRTWQVTLNPSATPSPNAAAQNYATVRVRVSWRQFDRTEQVEIVSVKGWSR